MPTTRLPRATGWVREFLAGERRGTEHIVERFAENGVYHSVPSTPIVGQAAINSSSKGFTDKPCGRIEIHHQVATAGIVMSSAPITTS